MRPVDVAVVGSGFAGSILARALAARGLAVALVDKARHPRFAIGESSTPLAALALERLADRYGLEDLWHLAAWGRWRRNLPELGCGLKRGFSFFAHAPGRDYANGPDDDSRLLVAASPADAVADTHWLRADVDAYLVGRARAEGVAVHEGAAVTAARADSGGVRLALDLEGTAESLECATVVDASGPAAVVARALGAGSGPPLVTRSGLVFAHLEGARPFTDVAAELGAYRDGAPYPEDLAAVHHLTPDGWVYVLRFDDGLVSAGLLVPEEVASAGADERWQRFLERYPSLGRQLGGARPVRPWRARPRIQHRLGAAAGPRWAALPHAYAFVDPLFSTGIAWSLLAVERLAGVLTGSGPARAAVASGEAFAVYAGLLAREAEQIDRLVAGAYRVLGDFRRFAAHALVYFVAVSWAETAQRLLGASPGTRRPAGCPGGEAAWDGFLGVGDPVLEELVVESGRRLAADAGGRQDAMAYERWLRQALAARDLVGLSDPELGRLVPVDLDRLVDRAPRLLGVPRRQVIAALPRLRGTVEADR